MTPNYVLQIDVHICVLIKPILHFCVQMWPYELIANGKHDATSRFTRVVKLRSIFGKATVNVS
jgi:hypothetical protein